MITSRSYTEEQLMRKRSSLSETKVAIKKQQIKAIHVENQLYGDEPSDKDYLTLLSMQEVAELNIEFFQKNMKFLETEIARLEKELQEVVR